MLYIQGLFLYPYSGPINQSYIHALSMHTSTHKIEIQTAKKYPIIVTKHYILGYFDLNLKL